MDNDWQNALSKRCENASHLPQNKHQRAAFYKRDAIITFETKIIAYSPESTLCKPKLRYPRTGDRLQDILIN
jgi:hypothetical protein